MTTALENLIKTLGIEKLPAEEQKEILTKADERLEDVLLRVVLENIADEEAKELRLVLEKGGDIEQKMAEVASLMPMLAEKMELAVAEEIERLKKVLE